MESFKNCSNATDNCPQDNDSEQITINIIGHNSKDNHSSKGAISGMKQSNHGKKPAKISKHMKRTSNYAGQYCFMPGCNFRTKLCPGITMHNFSSKCPSWWNTIKPVVDRIRKNMKPVPDPFRLCSRHFKPECFIIKSG